MATGIRFLLGEELRALDGFDPTLTVLEFLRNFERRTGTKEGCAEGDCGACTVVIGEADGEGMSYRAVNACIQFLATLDGKQLLSVEDLAAEDGSLHPVQQAMVEADASQCGFCTPGIVMSLFAYYHQTEPRLASRDALAGNLCRCTGYGPILQAAERITAVPPSDRFKKNEGDTTARLARIVPTEVGVVEGDGRRSFAPRSIEDLAKLYLDHPETWLVAGATDVGLWVTKQHRRPKTLIFLGEVEDLRRMAVTETGIEIGAAVTYREAAPLLARHFPDLGELFRRLGAVQVRNLGTLGGNIANGSPIGDSPPPLIVAGARLRLRRGTAWREIALEDFFLDYGRQDLAAGEFLETILVPLPEAGDRFACYKISKRFDQDISALLGAFRLRLDGARVVKIRIAFGGMAGIPKRAAAAEAALQGQAWNKATLSQAIAALAKDFSPIDDHRASAHYRLTVAGNLLRKFFLETTDDESSTRVLSSHSPLSSHG